MSYIQLNEKISQDVEGLITTMPEVLDVATLFPGGASILHEL